MPNIITIFESTAGLDTKSDPAKLKWTPEGGFMDLAVAYNIDISDIGRISRRKGFTRRFASGAHSIFAYGSICLFVTDNALTVLHEDFSTNAIRNVTPGARMDYEPVGNEIYYANGHEIGVVIAGSSFGWVFTEYIGPETTRTFSNPPIGRLIEYYNGRVYIVQDDVVWYSEPFNLNAFDLARNYIQLPGYIRMLKAVAGGLYVSTETDIFFYKGSTPEDFHEVKVADYPAIEGTAQVIQGRINFGQDGKPDVEVAWGLEKSAILLAEKGVCWGGSGGEFFNLTEKRIKLPKASTGAGLFHEGKYVGLLNP